MMGRNEAIRTMFSSLQDTTEGSIAPSGGGNVFHINAFSGASISINVTAVEKCEQKLTRPGFDEILHELDAEKRRRT